MSRALRGQRVCCGSPERGDGTWGEYMTTSANLCVPLRAGVSFEQGCNLLANPATAVGLLDMIRRGKHTAVIQTAAAGDLGRMLNRLCGERHIPLINIVRRGSKGLPARPHAVSQAQGLLARFESRIRRVVGLDELSRDVAQCAANATLGKTLIAPALRDEEFLRA